VGYHHKRQQFDRILSDAQTRTSVDLTIVAGDLNTFKLIRSRPRWTQLENAAAAAGFKDLTSEIRWTHSVPRLRFKQKLDAIFVKYTQPTQCRSWSLDVAGSDHIPVFAEIKAD
jgi:endonuclease/exonuclease/phosphatase family metal-dependent hydrolase